MKLRSLLPVVTAVGCLFIGCSDPEVVLVDMNGSPSLPDDDAELSGDADSADAGDGDTNDDELGDDYVLRCADGDAVVEGQVFDEEGQPRLDVSVELGEYDGDPGVETDFYGACDSVSSIDADPEGRFRFEDVDAGATTLRARSTGSGTDRPYEYRLTHVDIEPADGEVVEQRLDLEVVRTNQCGDSEGATISGDNFASDGETPMSNSMVYLVEKPQCGCMTDESGGFVLEDVPPGEYTVHVYRQFWSAVEDVEVQQGDDVDLELVYPAE